MYHGYKNTNNLDGFTAILLKFIKFASSTFNFGLKYDQIVSKLTSVGYRRGDYSK